MIDRPAVLFVCLGNICRSPLAEAACRHAAERLGLDVRIDSAGTGNWHVGEPPDRRAQAVARAHGIEIGQMTGRQVTVEDFERYDRIVALDHDNLAALQRLRPDGARAEVVLLLDHVPGREGEAVADPYFGGADGFDRTWDDVTRAAEGVLRDLAGAR